MPSEYSRVQKAFLSSFVEKASVSILSDDGYKFRCLIKWVF
jgi:hypothetical protein